MMLKWTGIIIIWLVLGTVNPWLGFLELVSLVAYGGYGVARHIHRQPAPPQLPAGTSWSPPAPATPAPIGERNSRTIPQDVKIAVAARDGGRCRQCGSTVDLHFDHVIPWSRGGANTVANIQLLCGPHNRAKGADDIPAQL